LLQKRFTVDFLTKEIKDNEGEVPQYYVEHNREAIISPQVFDWVQEEIKRHQEGKKRYSGVWGIDVLNQNQVRNVRRVVRIQSVALQ